MVTLVSLAAVKRWKGKSTVLLEKWKQRFRVVLAFDSKLSDVNLSWLAS